jgi:Bacterial Ig domain
MPVALVALAVALFCALAGTARAGTYDVTSCNSDGTAAGWTPYGGPAYVEAFVCPYNGDVSNRGLGVANLPNSGVIGNSSAGLMFKAPAGTSLVGIGTGIRVSRWDASYWVGLMTASGLNLFGYLPNDGAGPSSYSAHSWFALNREGNVRLEAGCPGLCDTASLPGVDRRVWGQMFDPITIRIEDDGTPSESLTGGGLIANAYATGTQSVTYSATDASGIRTTRLYVDGAKLRDDARSCNFEQPVPCSNVSNASYSLDTRSLSDGPHTVTVETVDSAGNSTSQSRSTIVDNTGPEAPSVSVTGGDGWRASDNFGASWATPSGQIAPITKAHYQLCRADDPGSCQAAGTQTGTNVNLLSGLRVPAEGDYTLSVWLQDAAGNTSAANSSAPVHLRYDATPPEQVRNLSVSGGDAWHSLNSFDLTWDNPPGQLAPITSTHYTLCDGGGTCITEMRDAAAGVHSLTDVSVPGPGDYVLTLWTGDEAGNDSEANASASVQLGFDDSDPGQAEVRRVDGWLNATDTANGYDEQVSLGGDMPRSGLAGFAVSLDGSAPGTTPDIGADGALHISDMPEGTVVVKARAISNSGVASSRIGSAVLSVDRTPPGVRASGAPDPDQWQPAAVSVTLTGSDQPGLSGMAGGHLSYSIDGAPERTSSGSSTTVTVGDDGKHTIRYQATDLAGNTSAEQSLSFKLDTTPPPDAVLNDPGRWLNASDAPDYVQQLGLEDGASLPLSGLAGYSITSDGDSPDATIETAGDSFDLGELAEGTTEIKARAVSGSGLTSSNVTRVQIHVDRTAPDVSLTSGPEPNAWLGSTARLELKATDALSGMSDGRIVYKLDNEDEASVRGDSTSLEVAADGAHTLRYYAVDAAGNRSDTKTASLKIDDQKPGVAVPESSAGWITSSGAYVEHVALRDGEVVSASGLAGFSVTTDGSTPDDTPETDATGDFPIDDLPEGITTVKARAISGAGLGSDSVGVGTIKVDRTAPVVSLARPERGSLVAQVSDASSGVRAGLLEMRAVGAPTWTPLTTVLRDGELGAALDLGRLAPGSYDLRATAVDAAGNQQVVTTFAKGGSATLVVEQRATGTTSSPAPAVVAPIAPKAAPAKRHPARCSVRRKHPKRGHRRRRSSTHHRKSHKRHARRGCRKGGEKHRHHHLTRKTHKRARKNAG